MSRIPYINEEVARRDFKYYIFDWDDNILHMPTKIKLEHLDDDGVWRGVEVLPSTFALVRTVLLSLRFIATSESGAMLLSRQDIANSGFPIFPPI